uniref:ZnF_CDGSH domain-containing protein n=1 Tax=Globodera pallida TaxID=36090 RepID=A0A183CTC9_GLOPA
LGWRSAATKLARCNKRVQLDKDKVVDTLELEDIGQMKAFCRCWQSKKFPYCDGTHNAHNKETGDNVGPLIIQKAKAAAS